MHLCVYRVIKKPAVRPTPKLTHIHINHATSYDTVITEANRAGSPTPTRTHITYRLTSDVGKDAPFIQDDSAALVLDKLVVLPL